MLQLFYRDMKTWAGFNARHLFSVTVTFCRFPTPALTKLKANPSCHFITLFLHEAPSVRVNPFRNGFVSSLNLFAWKPGSWVVGPNCQEIERNSGCSSQEHPNEMGALTGGFGPWGCCSHQVRVGCLTVSHLHLQSSKPCQISDRKHLALLRELWPKEFSKGINLKCKSSRQIPALETILLDPGKMEEIIWAGSQSCP